jgi:pSer/pThr/pTyr-binding forkhead associated (FHA) protein
MSGPLVLALRILLAACLYLFLGLAFYSLWKEIRQQADALSARKVPPIRLQITPDGMAAQVRQFSQASVTLGRDPACECQLDDQQVSARHARLSYHHGQWWLEDLDSTNGITLSGSRLTTPAVLMSADEFTCGTTTILVMLDDEIREGSQRK